MHLHSFGVKQGFNSDGVDLGAATTHGQLQCEQHGTLAGLIVANKQVQIWREIELLSFEFLKFNSTSFSIDGITVLVWIYGIHGCGAPAEGTQTVDGSGYARQCRGMRAW